MMDKNIFLIIFLLIFIFIPTYAATQNNRLNVYNMAICKEDILLNLPLNRYSYWFYIPEGTNLTHNCYLNLIYSYSGTLISNLSLITVYLNGYPIMSKSIVELNKNLVNIKLKIPISKTKKGYNEITISTRQRSIEGICKDLDNDSNWILLHNNSLLHLETIDKPYKISYFPYPFIDPLKSENICNFVFYLPKNFDNDELEVLFYLANSLALIERYKNLSYNVSFDNPFEKKNENQILVGKANKWESLKKEDFIGSLEENDGLVYMSNKDSLRLYITGKGKGIWKAAEYIVNEKQIKLSEKNPTIIKTLKGKKYAKEINRNTIKLVDLGFKNLVITGAYHQSTSLLVKSPIGFDKINKGSFIELHFSHAPVLDDKSILTVYINGVPVKSESLDGKNLENGRLKIFFPESELDKKEWLIDIKVYHNLRNVDCDKRFDEVAWTKIYGSSLIYFVESDEEEYPNLKNLLRGNPEDIYIWLGEEINSYEITSLATLIGKIGQNMGERYSFNVLRGKNIDKNLVSGKDIIFVGKFNDSRIENIENYLWIIPSKEKFRFKKELNIYIDGFNTDIIFQSNYSPFKGKLYSIFYAEEDSLVRLNSFLNRVANINKIDGQVTLITKLGSIYSEILAEQKVKFKFLFNITPTILYLLILSIILILSIFLIIWNRRKI